MIDAILGGEGDLGGGDAGLVDWRVKPALLTLLYDQAVLIDASAVDVDSDLGYDLRTGFPSRRGVIRWYQRAAVRTLGHIADDWPPEDCFNDEALIASLVQSPLGPVDPLPPRKAKIYRTVLESKAVLPSCNRAYRELRPAAAEYVKSDTEGQEHQKEKSLDPSKQAHLAMRPGFRILDAQQARALETLWDGFDSEEDLLNWLHGLNSPSNGEIRGELSHEVMTDPVAIQHLVTDPHSRTARIYQDVLAVSQLLPAFVAGVKATEPAELAKAKGGGPTTMRMK